MSNLKAELHHAANELDAAARLMRTVPTLRGVADLAKQSATRARNAASGIDTGGLPLKPPANAMAVEVRDGR